MRRRFWIGIAVGAICWLLAAFTVGYAVGGHEAMGGLISDLRANPQISKDSNGIQIFGGSYSGDYWAGVVLVVIGTVAFILGARFGRRRSS